MVRLGGILSEKGLLFADKPINVYKKQGVERLFTLTEKNQNLLKMAIVKAEAIL